MAKGMIFDIEEFTLHDGPGVRKTVFFKGCPLNCKWCHNPEGISFHKELMVSQASCVNCGKCEAACERKVTEECRCCGKCVNVCPRMLRKICGREYHTAELAKELLKGREILDESGGGITFSGGEPLAQPEFLAELIKELNTVHLTVETSGYASPKVFANIISSVDYVFMDLKHTDSDVHRKYTGVGNEIIVSNLKMLCSSGKRFCLRVPLIPGVNDSLSNMEKTAALLRGAVNLDKVEILPYHRTAGAKYPMLGKEYEPDFDDRAVPAAHTEAFKKLGIRSEIL